VVVVETGPELVKVDSVTSPDQVEFLISVSVRIPEVVVAVVTGPDEEAVSIDQLPSQIIEFEQLVKSHIID